MAEFADSQQGDNGSAAASEGHERDMNATFKWLMRLSAVGALVLMVGFVLFSRSVAIGGGGEPTRVDAIVALTGGESRIDEAVKLLADGVAKRLLISGVNPITSRHDLERIAPGRGDLFDCCIDIGRYARDTVGNAVETRDWVARNGFSKVIVVTSSYHMPRGLVELRRAMPGIKFFAHPVTPVGFYAETWWAHPGSARLLVFEYLKFLPAAARLVVSEFMAPPNTTASSMAPASMSRL